MPLAAFRRNYARKTHLQAEIQDVLETARSVYDSPFLKVAFDPSPVGDAVDSVAPQVKM